jgi:L-arabinokinase
MGGMGDYSGALVLQTPILNKTIVSIKLRTDYKCHLKSNLPEGISEVWFNYEELTGCNYESTHQLLTQEKETAWIAYVIGCAYMLQQEKGIDFKGADFFIESDIPLGKGVSSSAALEVAAMKALAKAFSIDFQGTELAILAQRVENLIVGAPCGLMDQLSSYFGNVGELLPIICQPDQIQKPIRIPDNLHFIGIDSGVRHAVSGSSYSDVRCAAFMGYSIIAQHLGVSVREIRNAKETNNWKNLPYGGYLCNISLDEFESRFKELIPVKISGKDFLGKYGHTTDSVTTIKPIAQYNILNCASHPINENERVKKFQFILSEWNGKASQAIELGRLMFQAHESYSSCGLGSDRTDEIVDLAQEYELEGIYGAKITGGGSGGTVCLLALGKEGIQSSKKIHQMMENKCKTKLAYFD